MSAYIRRINRDGIAAVLRRRGAVEAGAVYVKLDRLDGRAALYGPAPQIDAEAVLDRRFIRLHKAEWIDPLDAETRLKREVEFDSDIWIVEVENRDGDPGLDIATV